MRVFVLSLMLFLAVLFPKVGSAQVFQLPSAVPQVTASDRPWQINREPIFYAGAFYYPTGPTVFFDGAVMVRTALYDGVPLYVDSTLEPYSVVFVPVGRNVMRPYERPRTGPLAGTVGSRTPSFPIQRDVELSVTSPTTGIQTPPPSGGEPVVIPRVVPEGPRPVGTVGLIARPSTGPSPSAIVRVRPRANVVESIPRPLGNSGIWIEFNGERWQSAGAAVSYAPDRFIRFGEYRGFPVYRAATGSSSDIYVPAVTGGALTPYSKR